MIYKTDQHSYRDFPLRMAELGLVHRHEMSGVLHGLFRVRLFTQDDAHIYCLPEQVEDEVLGVIELVRRMYRTFGFEQVHVELSTRPEKSIGSDEMWQTAEAALATALERGGARICPQPRGRRLLRPEDRLPHRGRHGPDLAVRDLPARLRHARTARPRLRRGGQPAHRPVMIHRTVLGSVERFLAILIEHYGGALPPWLAPVQAVVIPVADRHAGYAETVRRALAAAGLRAEVDAAHESVSKKIRDGEVLKVPFLLVVGDREV